MSSDFGLVQMLSNPSEIVKERHNFASNTRLRNVVAISARRYIMYVVTLLVPFYLSALSFASEFERRFDVSFQEVGFEVRYRLTGKIWEATISKPLSPESIIDQLLLFLGQTFNADPMSVAFVIRTSPNVIMNVLLLPILAVGIYHLSLYVTGVSPQLRNSVIAIEHSVGIYLISAYSLYTIVVPSQYAIRSDTHPEAELIEALVSFLIDGPAILIGPTTPSRFPSEFPIPILTTFFILLLLYSVYSLYLHSRINQNAGRMQSLLSIVLLLAIFMALQLPLPN